MAEPLETGAIGRFAHRHEGAIAGEIVRREAQDLALHRVGIAGIVEGVAVVEADAVERRHRPQIDVVRKSAAAQRPQFLEQERRGDDGRSGVEGEAVLPVHAGAAARRVELLQHGDAITARAEPDRGGKSAKAGADHDRMRAAVMPRTDRCAIAGDIEHGYPAPAGTTPASRAAVRMMAAHSSGRSSCARWPSPGSVTIVDCGSNSCTRSACDGGMVRSREPTTSVSGTFSRGSAVANARRSQFAIMPSAAATCAGLLASRR